MNWCMMPLSATGAVGEWLANRPLNMQGNTMDGVNILLVITPPPDVLAAADRVVHLPDDATGQELVAIIGRELTISGNVVITGTADQFSLAYQRWEWWAWCAQHAYESDADSLFLELLNSSPLPVGITRMQAREFIKQVISDAG